MNPSDSLRQLIRSTSLLYSPPTSRVHPLKNFDFPDSQVFVKREDELGFGISGSKLRKYLSLIPHLVAQKADEALCIGSPYSNHLLSFVQLLIENSIKPILFLIGNPPLNPKGNFLFTSLFLEPDNIHWFPKSKKGNIMEFAEQYIEDQAKKRIRVSMIPEGGSCCEAIPGLLTLAEDILANEEQLNLNFDHIFMDAGTGMMAATVVQAFAFLKRKTHFHIIQMAGSPVEFEENIKNVRNQFSILLKQKVPAASCFTLYRPQNAPSFGSVNQKVLRTIREIARIEGFLTDPVYTAKLFHEAKEIMQRNPCPGRVLLVHSGGALSLSGFQEALFNP